MEPVRGPANDYFLHAVSRSDHFPRLLADIGGTNLRLAIEQEEGRMSAVFVRPLKTFASLTHAIHAYFSEPQAIAAGAQQVRVAVIAIANPVEGDAVRMTNADWSFSIEAVRRELGFETLMVVNDFTALAMAIPRLSSQQYRQVGGGAPQSGYPIGVIGPGTGLGVSGLIPAGDTWLPLATEGGHVSFAPVDDREIDILRFAWQEFAHVSAERLLTGSGIERLYRALTQLAGVKTDALDAPEITRRALACECPLCDEAVERFCLMLGTVASNLALTLGARGGIYIGGGIVPRLGDRFDRSGFRNRFETKGRFSGYLAAIPTFVITADHPALLGAGVILKKALAPAD